MKVNRPIRWSATGLLVVAAAVCIWVQYRTYFDNPWTRDGLVQAQVVEVAARVSGPVHAVHVTANQYVRAKDVLFEIEDSMYRAALALAVANLEQKQALAHEIGETHRAAMPPAMPPALAAARAAVRVAEAQCAEARLNLSFTKVTAPVDGYVTNPTLQPGSMAVAYTPLFALISADTFWIDAFFRETIIHELKEGDAALVTLMSYPDTPLKGVVTSIGRGIARQNDSTGEKLLPIVSPTFEWIRLAQRIPVRVHLVEVPPDIQLRMGTTASVLVRVKPGKAFAALPFFLQ